MTHMLGHSSVYSTLPVPLRRDKFPYVLYTTATLIDKKLKVNGIPPHVLRWMATFLLDRSRVKIGNVYSDSGSPNGGVP